VDINGSNDGNVVGADLAAQRNLISGNEGDGVFAGTDGTDTIRGEPVIGTDKAGTGGLHNGGGGVSLDGQNSVVSDNTIAFNTSDGVQVKSNSTGTGHDIGPNSIVSNDGLGIDLVNNANFDQGPNGQGPNTNDGGRRTRRIRGPTTCRTSQRSPPPRPPRAPATQRSTPFSTASPTRNTWSGSTPTRATPTRARPLSTTSW